MDLRGKKEQQIKHKSLREKVRQRDWNVGTASKGALCNHQYNPCKITRQRWCVCTYVCVCVFLCMYLIKMDKIAKSATTYGSASFSILRPCPHVHGYFLKIHFLGGQWLNKILKKSRNSTLLEKDQQQQWCSTRGSRVETDSEVELLLSFTLE